MSGYEQFEYAPSGTNVDTLMSFNCRWDLCDDCGNSVLTFFRVPASPPVGRANKPLQAAAGQATGG